MGSLPCSEFYQQAGWLVHVRTIQFTNEPYSSLMNYTHKGPHMTAIETTPTLTPPHPPHPTPTKVVAGASVNDGDGDGVVVGW